MRLKFAHVLIAWFLFTEVKSNTNGNYKVGVGISDVTGPAAEIGMMGFANPSQSAEGIHTRLFSRAFIFQSGNDPPVVFVSADIGMVDQGIKFTVVEKLQEKYGALYHEKNVLLSGTHTHSGPGGFLQYLLYGISSRGFLQSSFDAIVEGIFESIEKAHNNLQPGKLLINKGKVEGANINRSPSSYESNPEWERNMYTDGNTDKDMVLLRLESQDGRPLGIVNWFAVHPTSMNNTNKLLSGDNKGYASMQFEYKMNPSARPGKGNFVAAFASTNLGDVSPNTKGARCIDTGEPCDREQSTCGGRNQNCIAFGPGKDMEESTEIIGRKQYEVAYELFKDENKTSDQLKGPVKFIHQYVDMTNYEVEVLDPLSNKTVHKTTCKGALGYSFAAGTTDGPGAFDFVQGDKTGNRFWDTVRILIKKPSKELIKCHAPKPVLLAVGEARRPYDWAASIVETQILRIGDLYIVAVPGELTTMAGRRVRRALQQMIRAAEKIDCDDEDGPPFVVLAGLSNVYTHYITTFEEYQKQRYEAASTLYGPYTLDAYLKQYKLLAKHMMTGTHLDPGPKPPNLLNRQLSFITPVVFDTSLFKKYGDVIKQPKSRVKRGETVVAKFVGGHPRNHPSRRGTFLAVEKEVNENNEKYWKTIATDADWSTKFHWSRPPASISESFIKITWKVPENQEPGKYRIHHFGYYKSILHREPTPYNGITNVFIVVS